MLQGGMPIRFQTRNAIRVVLALLAGLVASVLLSLAANLDAEAVRAGAEPSAFVLLWRGLVPPSWRVEDTYDILAVTRSDDDGVRICRDHIAALRFDNALALMEFGRGLYDDVRLVEPLSDESATSEWAECLDNVSADTFYYPIIVAEGVKADLTSRGLTNSAVVPPWLRGAGAGGRLSASHLSASRRAASRWGEGWLPNGTLWAPWWVESPTLAIPIWSETRKQAVQVLSAAPTATAEANISKIGAHVHIGQPVHIPRARSQIVTDEMLLSGVNGIRISESRAYGWPLRCFVAHGVRQVHWERDRSAGASSFTVTDTLWTSGKGVVDAGARAARPLYDAPAVGLALTPIWSLLFVNASLFAGALLCAQSAPRALRIAFRWMTTRRSLGRCRHCGYSRRGLAHDAVCPECGSV